MLQSFREWLDEELLDEEEKWFTTDNGHKMAYDTESGKITKGLFAGGNMNNLAELSKNASKFAGKKDKDAIIKSINKNANKTKGQSNKDVGGYNDFKYTKKGQDYANSIKRQAQQKYDKYENDMPIGKHLTPTAQAKKDAGEKSKKYVDDAKKYSREGNDQFQDRNSKRTVFSDDLRRSKADVDRSRK